MHDKIKNLLTNCLLFSEKQFSRLYGHHSPAAAASASNNAQYNHTLLNHRMDIVMVTTILQCVILRLIKQLLPRDLQRLVNTSIGRPRLYCIVQVQVLIPTTIPYQVQISDVGNLRKTEPDSYLYYDYYHHRHYIDYDPPV